MCFRAALLSAQLGDEFDRGFSDCAGRRHLCAFIFVGHHHHRHPTAAHGSADGPLRFSPTGRPPPVEIAQRNVMAPAGVTGIERRVRHGRIYEYSDTVQSHKFTDPHILGGRLHSETVSTPDRCRPSHY